jgi:replicative DNA helicase
VYAQDGLAKLPIFIDDTPAVSILQIRAKARRIASKAGRPIDCIVVDYLSLMTPEMSDGASREREIAATTAALKRLARELKCPVILLAQLNRLCELREDKRPKLSDLRESGAVEQDADAVIFIYRDDYYHEASERKGIAELIVAKQRNGPTGTVCVAFHAPSTAFRNLHHEEPSNQAA